MKLTWNDFSQGWCPSDNPTGGRPNGLLAMENLNLTENGALSINSGTYLLTVPESEPHTLFTRVLGGAKRRYYGSVNGRVYRDLTTSILSGGSSTRAAFGVAYNYVLICSGDQRKKDDGTVTAAISMTAPTVAANMTTAVLGGSLNGIYTWKYVYVKKNGAFLEQSVSAPASAELAVDPTLSVTVYGTNPLLADPDVQEIWVFRKGGNLDQYYRVKILDAYFFGAAPQFFLVDQMSDETALASGDSSTGAILNEFLLTVNATDTPEEILEIAGPIYGRTCYFTEDSILISLINNPVTYDVRTVISYAGATAEKFMFAKKISENAILVGTSRDLYLLTGTFALLPDGFLDIYLRPLGCTFPPLCRDVTIYNGNAVYMASDGWRAVSFDGTSQTLVRPNLDLLYEGKARFSVNPTNIQPYETLRYSCAAVQNKLYVSETDTYGNTQCKVYDFTRKVWSQYSSVKPTLYYGEEDDSLIAYCDDGDLRLLNYALSNLVDTATQPTIRLQTPFQSGGATHVRKTAQTLKIQANTGGNDLAINLYIDGSFNSAVYQGALINGTFEISNFDLKDVGTWKSFAVEIYGQTDTFTLTSIEITCDPFIEQVTFLYLLPDNFGTPGIKRLSQRAIVINTFGSPVQLDCFVDGELVIQRAISTPEKQTVIVDYGEMIEGVDFAYQFSSPLVPFEFYGFVDGQNDIETLPTQRSVFISLPSNLGSPYKKRLATWPLVVNTRGEVLSVTPWADGVAQPAQGFITNRKETVFYVFNSCEFAVDYWLTIQGTNFELFEILPPAIVQQLPIKKRFDVVGNTELFKYGRVKEMQVRLFMEGASTIPFEVYFTDGSSFGGEIPTHAGEDVYSVIFPKTVGDRIFRVELGPASLDFHRYYVRLKASRSGVDTELEWIMLNDETAG